MKQPHHAIAHIREADGKQQSLAEHLVNVGNLVLSRLLARRHRLKPVRGGDIE
ncbi:MAG: hypothetical protein LBV01_01100 [Deltaproteobacteria bacterium]|jgi:hypothetical protein|nr:hypothetical protein [Deltaproteobacteria bacterium]